MSEVLFFEDDDDDWENEGLYYTENERIDADHGFICFVCEEFINNEKVGTINGVYICCNCKYKISMGHTLPENSYESLLDEVIRQLSGRQAGDVFKDIKDGFIK